jgi:uncharacterized protein YdhG (YjbR/CyaY superfamily)
MAKQPPPSVDAYINALDADRKAALTTLRAVVRKCLPGADECIQHGMPAYVKGDRMVCAIASQKQYMALYVCEGDGLDDHRADFAHLNVGKGCIRFRRLEDLPMKSVQKVLKAAGKRAKA